MITEDTLLVCFQALHLARVNRLMPDDLLTLAARELMAELRKHDKQRVDFFNSLGRKEATSA